MNEKAKCGCGGRLSYGQGCLTYYGSDDHNLDTDHEGFMRHGGMGFGTAMDSRQAMMSMHLQANGLSHEDTDRLLVRSATP